MTEPTDSTPLSSNPDSGSEAPPREPDTTADPPPESETETPLASAAATGSGAEADESEAKSPESSAEPMPGDSGEEAGQDGAETPTAQPSDSAEAAGEADQKTTDEAAVEAHQDQDETAGEADPKTTDEAGVEADQKTDEAAAEAEQKSTDELKLKHSTQIEESIETLQSNLSDLREKFGTAAPEARSKAAKAPRSRKRKPGESVGDRLAARRAEQSQAQALLFKAWARRISTILIIIMAVTLFLGPFLKTHALRFVASSVADPAWFHWAVQKLEESSPTSAVDLYVDGLSTTDPNHRFHYHAWIQKHAEESHRGLILEAAKSEDTERRRAGLRAVYILIDHEWMRSREVYQLIAEVLREDADQRCRTFATLCLEKNGRKPPAVVRPALHAALKDPYASVRVNSLKVLSRFAREEDEEVFAGCLKDPVAEVRWAAAAALARLGRPSSVRVLAERARTGTADGRREVLKVLGDIAHPSATKLLLSLTNDIEDDIAAQAIRLLGGRKGSAVDAALLGALRVRNPRIRTAATRVVGDRGMTAAVSRLIENLSSYDNWSELEALDAALHKLTQATGIPAPSGDEASRRATVQAWRAWANSRKAG